METETLEVKVARLKIGNTDIFLEDFEKGQGKITVSDTSGHNYSNYWGAMGDGLKDFISQINADYFADKLMGHKKNTELDVKGTFAEVRKYIREEIGLPWYQHLEFQKDMREKLSAFESEVSDTRSEEFFVHNFHGSFVDGLDFWLVKDKYEREQLEKAFKGIQEHWYFLQTQPNREYLWLKNLHAELKKKFAQDIAVK